MPVDSSPDAFAKVAAAINTYDIWAAGFMDGEGTFYARKNNVRSCTARVTASQRIRRPLDILYSLYGGRVEWIPSSSNKRGGIWRWTIEDRAGVIDCLERLIPWLQLKRDQAELLLQIAHLINPRLGRDRAGVDRDGIFARQMELSEQMLSIRRL
jgi:hypothetical protein